MQRTPPPPWLPLSRDVVCNGSVYTALSLSLRFAVTHRGSHLARAPAAVHCRSIYAASHKSWNKYTLILCLLSPLVLKTLLYWLLFYSCTKTQGQDWCTISTSILHHWWTHTSWQEEIHTMHWPQFVGDLVQCCINVPDNSIVGRFSEIVTFLARSTV